LVLEKAASVPNFCAWITNFLEESMKHLRLIATLSATAAASSALHADTAQTTSATTTPFIEYHNRIAVFDSYHLTYERTKTNSLYAGVEGWLLPVARSHQAIVEGEFRMGYNFFWNGRDHFTPIAGIGYFQQLHKRHFCFHKHKPGIVYATFGFLYDHEFTKTFNLGLNVKGLLGGPVSDKHFNWGSPVVGIDVSLPITFRFGYKRRWDVRLEPFDLYLHGSNHSENYFGGRSTIGFRF
jgi:hypothetical protein